MSEFTGQAIRTILGAFGAMFCTVGFANSFGVFEEYYLENQLADQSESNISWIGALEVFFIFAGSIVTGPFLDMFGPEAMFWIGSIGTVFSVMMTSLCHELYQFILAQGILLGISMTLILCPTVAVISQNFKQHRAAAMGITIAGSSLGGVVWPIAAHELFEKPNVGFGWTMRIIGFIMLPILVMACLVIRPPKEQKGLREQQQHQETTQPPSTPQQSRASLQQLQQMSDEGASRSPVSITEKKQSPPRRFYLSPLKSPTIQLCCLAFFLAYFSMFTPIFFITSYSSTLGLSSTFSFYTTSIVNGASLFGRVLPGFAADRYGKFNCCILATLFSGIISLCWTKATSEAGVGVFIAAYGFSSGAILSLQQACAAQVSSSASMGTAIGTVMAATSLSGLAGIPVSGELAGKYGFLALSIYSGVSMLVGTVILIAARIAQEKRLLAIV
ncbi:MFS general substrate transporter [Aspergillus similis]